jgi:hypothetical protein
MALFSFISHVAIVGETPIRKRRIVASGLSISQTESYE